MQNGIIEVRKSIHTRKQRMSLNEKVQHQRKRIAELEAEIESLGGSKGIAELKRVSRDFDREVKKLRLEYEAHVDCLKKDLRVAIERYQAAEEREIKLEWKLDEIRRLTVKGGK